MRSSLASPGDSDGTPQQVLKPESRGGAGQLPGGFALAGVRAVVSCQ